jgi:thiamine pyrophosphate-dependent acetolactate synthase large subunit-like protein
MDMINKAERPIIVAGQGVFRLKAWDQLKVAAEKKLNRRGHGRPTAGST